jgi:hypothetical protein
MKSFSSTRWWSHWEVTEQLMVQFGDVATFLNLKEIGSPATVSNSPVFSLTKAKVFTSKLSLQLLWTLENPL